MTAEEDTLATAEAPPRYSELIGEARQALGITLFWLALPVLGEQFLTSCVGLVDTLIAGRISRAATIAVGLASYVNWFAMLLSHFVTAGTHALVSRHWGAAERHDAEAVANESIRVAALAGVLLGGVFFAIAPAFARIQGLEGEAYAVTVQYLRVTAFAQPFTTLFLVAAYSLRAVGDMRTPMLVSVFANVVNALVSWFLTFGIAGVFEGIGVKGIAVGTVAARVLSALVLLGMMAGGLLCFRLRGWTHPLELGIIRRVLRIGAPAAAEGVIMWTGQLVFLVVIGHLAGGTLGEAYYAAHVVGIRIESLTYLPAVAWGAAGATLVGQFLGARMPTEARRAGHTAAFQGAVLGLICGLCYYIWADALYALMHHDPLVRRVGVPAFRMLAFFQPLLVMAIVYGGCLRGAGATRLQLTVTSIGIVAVRLPLAVLAGILLRRGLIGAWTGMCTDIAVRAGLGYWLFRRGKWADHIP